MGGARERPEFRGGFERAVYEYRSFPEQVREEAGIHCELGEKLDSIDYWYVDRWGNEPVRVHKYVHFFLMLYLNGDINDHDDEVEEVCWADLEEAIGLLAFPAEKRILAKAKDLIV